MKLTKTNFYLILIVLLALVLRIISAVNFTVNTDEMVYSIIPIDIISTGKLGTVEQSTLYFYIKDIGYRIFGFSPLTSRLPEVIFGTLTVVLIFLISKEIFNDKKTSLIAAFLFAVSGYSIRYNIEPDPGAVFFSLFSILFYIKALRYNTKNFYLSAISLAFAIFSKAIAALIIPALIVHYLYYSYKNKNKASSLIIHENNKNSINKKILKTLIISIILFLIAFAPVFAYNYLTIKYKGYGDYYFSSVLGFGESIHKNLGLSGDKSWEFSLFLVINKAKAADFLKTDAAIFIFGLIGLVFILKDKKEFSGLLLLSGLFTWLYLTGLTGSDSHYIIILALFSIFGAYILNKASSNLTNKNIKFKNIILFVLIAIAIVNIFQISENFTRKSAIVQLRNFAETIPENALVVTDPMVYRGISAWAFNDKHYLEGNYFPEILQKRGQIPGQEIDMPFYYIECSFGTCLWSTEDYERIKNFSKNLTADVAEITSQVASFDYTNFGFKVHYGTIKMGSGVLDIADSLQSFYFYPVAYKNKERIPDLYQVEGFFDKLINGIGFIVLYIDVLAALGSIIFLFYLVKKQE